MRNSAARIAILTFIFLAGIAATGQENAPLKLVTKYEMPGSVKGRFDHVNADVSGDRLFVAAESAHQVLVFSLREGKFQRAITDIQIPHATFVRDDINRIYVTDGGSGALKIYDGKTYELLKTVPLKVDADSIGYDPATHYLYIDNGGGDAHETFSMFSTVDTTTGEKVGDLKVDGDTLEAMALEKSSPRIFVNNRAKNQVDVIDRKSQTLVASWPVKMGKVNVAMALDEAAHRLFVGTRDGEIVALDTETGKELQALPIAKGIDDLIFDPTGKRIYASCGNDQGSTDVYQEVDADHFISLGRVATGPGGKNEALVAELGRYFVIVPPAGTAAGAVYVYQIQ
jgi:DNA-binding beta-propeller fold protein YncE